MSTTSNNPVFPRWFLLGAAGLMISTMVFAFVARQTDAGALRVNRAPDAAQVMIRFDEQPDGSVLVRRQPDDTVLDYRLATEVSGQPFLHASVTRQEHQQATWARSAHLNLR